MRRMFKREAAKTHEVGMCFYDIRQVVGGQEYRIKKPTRFMFLVLQTARLQCAGSEIEKIGQVTNYGIEAGVTNRII